MFSVFAFHAGHTAEEWLMFLQPNALFKCLCLLRTCPRRCYLRHLHEFVLSTRNPDHAQQKTSLKHFQAGSKNKQTPKLRSRASFHVAAVVLSVCVSLNPCNVRDRARARARARVREPRQRKEREREKDMKREREKERKSAREEERKRGRQEKRESEACCDGRKEGRCGSGWRWWAKQKKFESVQVCYDGV